jgi:hypothetical protein
MNTNNMSFEQLCDLFSYIPKRRPLSSVEVATLLCMHPATVNQFRVRGDGPRHFKPSGTRRVWYAESDVLAWMASGARQSTSENTAA